MAIRRSDNTPNLTRPAQSEAQTPSKPKGEAVEVAAPKNVSAAEREAVAAEAANKLLDVVKQFKDIDGDKGMAGWGQGDSRVTNRRSAVHTLISERSGAGKAVIDKQALRSISKEIDKDMTFLASTDLKDYSLDGNGQFDWYKPFNNHTIDNVKIGQEFKKRVREQQGQAAGLSNGSQRFFDASSMSIVGLSLIPDASKRSNAMMDALLQFRGRTDAANQGEDARTTRIDRFGLALLAEQRATLGAMKFDQNDPAAQRDYALVREVIASHPISSTNQIYEARNAVANILTDQGSFRDRMSSANSPTAWVWKEAPPGASASPYSSIHHNFSRDTPNNITLAVEEWMMPKGKRESRVPLFLGLVDVMKRLPGTGDDTKRAIESLAKIFDKAGLKSEMPDLSLSDPAKAKANVEEYLTKSCAKNLGQNPIKNIEMMARVYISVCAEQPSAESLEKKLFRAGEAWPEVADVIAAVVKDDDLTTLNELGEARLAMKGAIQSAKSGYERHELIKMDSEISRMTNEHLGASVERTGNLATPAQRLEGLVAVRTALRSAVASGLDDIISDSDKRAQPNVLKNALGDVEKMMSGGKTNETDYRALMGNVSVAISKTIQNIRAFSDVRAAEVASGSIDIDPYFNDQFVKQTPLHYATAIAEQGMRVGLKQVITPRKIENVDGMRVLNGIGPVVFSSVVFAENATELTEMGITKDQLAVLLQLEEKKMVAVGGMMVDTEHAPGGNSHLNMYAMNSGIPVMALPDLRNGYNEFFKTAAKEGGVYVDDSDGFSMMTVKKAQEEGRVGKTQEALDELRPGVNRKITFLEPSADGESFNAVHKHDAIINPNRVTHDVEIFLPADEVKGIGRGVPGWKELATLGTHARHLAGEKGTVLALLAEHPKLKRHTKPGSTVTPADVSDLLKGATLKDGSKLSELWKNVWDKDPKVGVVDDQNFLDSAFYTDTAYRKTTRETLQHQTREGLEKSLLDMSKTPPVLSDAGKELYKNIMANQELADNQNGSIIFRSSYTAEDRPGKSGAGQYESYVDRSVASKILGVDKAVVNASFDGYEKAWKDLDAAKKGNDPAKLQSAQSNFDAVSAKHNELLGPARVWGVIGVVESAWMPEPVENNVAEEFFLKNVAATCACQATVKPEFSGVVISRDLENGAARGAISFQLVKGFGGGVEGGKTTEGVVNANAVNVSITDGEAKASHSVDVQGLPVSDKDMKKLRELVLETEQFFQDVIEKGAGHAVDMEVAYQEGEWYIVQARVIQV